MPPPKSSSHRQPAAVAGPAAIVTGGAGEGIGHGITEALVEDGWRVLVVDRDRRKAASLQHRLRQRGTRIELLIADIAVPATARQVVKLAHKTFGRLDGLVNNAGVGLVKPIHQASDADFERLLKVDLLAALRFCRAAIPTMRDGGSIVNIGSVHAISSFAGYGLYASVKSALEGLTRGLAVDYGPKRLRANIVHPGFVASPQNRALIQRFTPDVDTWIEAYADTKQLLPDVPSARQVGDLVAFLLGPKSTSITGQSIAIDGGSTAMLYEREPKR